jgi:predicted dehydrogenase
LVEKPGGMNLNEIEKLNTLANEKNANVLVAYNRRFYASTLKAIKIIEEDGGVSSFQFEFTEWAHVIEPLKTPIPIKNKWFLANSSHVVDLAFYLGGKPKEISCYKSGNLSWHNTSKFSGAGITNDEAVFSYHANWAAPGRWSLEILTNKHRLYFKPMETLQVQKLGTVNILPVDINDSLDKAFKPGLFLQTKSFLNNEFNNFCKINDQLDAMKYYNQMSGYESV